MAQDIEIQADQLKQFGKGAVDALANINQALVSAMTRYGIDLQNYAEGRFTTGYSPSASRSRNYLQTRSGAGRRSFIVDVQGQGASVNLQFATQQFYVAVQEFGAEIRPVNRQYLTIPLDDNLNPSGEPYETAPEAIELGAYFYEATDGNLYIVREDEGGQTHDGLEFLFWLTEGPVTIPKRLGLGEFIERKDVQEKLVDDVAVAILRVVREVIR